MESWEPMTCFRASRLGRAGRRGRGRRTPDQLAQEGSRAGNAAQKHNLGVDRFQGGRSVLSNRPFLETGFQVGQRYHQHHRVKRGRLEANPHIEIPRLDRERVNYHSANADGIRRLDDTQSSITNQCPANSFAAPRFVYSKASEDHDGNRIRHVAANSAWRCNGGDRAGSESIVSEHTATLAGNKSSGRAGCLVLQGTALEPMIQALHARHERINVMIRVQWLRR